MQVSDEVKAFLRTQGFAVLALELDLGQGPEAVVVVKATRDVVGALRGREAPVEVGWLVERTDDGPVLCLALRCEEAGVGELAGEAFFDPADPDDLALLGRLATQERLRVAFLDEELEPAWVAALPWDEVRRLETDQARDRAEELLERAPGYDFARAKERFHRDVPLDVLLGRALPGIKG